MFTPQVCEIFCIVTDDVTTVNLHGQVSTVHRHRL